MPCWYYDRKELKNTPSIQDDIDYDTECRYRKEGARFIISVGTKMDLGYNTMATGVVYFHRFYMFHSFRNFPRYVTACCCLLLAGKVEETPKKCNAIIKIARTLLTDSKFQTFGEDPKEEVMTLERILLQTIKFDLQVEHPYQYLLKYAKCLKGNKEKLQKMVQMAWTFVNDSLCTTLSLQWEPEVIAVALMYLAGKLSKFEVTDWAGRTSKHLFWWDMFVEDVTMNLLEDICHQVLDLYSAPQQATAPDSPPLKRSSASKKEKTLPIPIVISPNITPLTPPPGKAAKAPGEKGSIQDKSHLLSENSSGSNNYYPPGLSGVTGGTPTYPATFTTPATGPSVTPTGIPSSSNYPPAFPPTFTSSGPPTSGSFYPRPPSNYFMPQ